jgi:hypothetical protein
MVIKDLLYVHLNLTLSFSFFLLTYGNSSQGLLRKYLTLARSYSVNDKQNAGIFRSVANRSHHTQHTALFEGVSK